MHAHNLLIDQCYQRHVVERVVEGLPQRELVSPLDLVEESVDARRRLALMVATQQDDLAREPDL